MLGNMQQRDTNYYIKTVMPIITYIAEKNILKWIDDIYNNK